MKHKTERLSRLEKIYEKLPLELGSYDIVNLLIYGCLDLSLIGFTPHLSVEEVVIASRILKKSNRDNFILRRTLLKQLLSCLMNVSAADVVFDKRAQPKPSVVNGPFFSHSNKLECLVYSFSTTSEHGIDIECSRRKIDAKSIASLFFSSEEKQKLANSPTKSKLQSFFEIWTKKEAIVKCFGKEESCSTKYSKEQLLSWKFDAFQLAIAAKQKLSAMKTFTYLAGWSE